MSFPLGKPVLVMLLIAVAGGAGMVAWPAERRHADVRVWTFADSHARSYDAVLPAYHAANPGVTADVEIVAYNALNVRLISMFMSGRRGADAPDLAEVEIGAVGQYFRPPVREVGFLSLDDFLRNSGAREIPSVDAPGERGWNARLAGTTDVYTHDGTAWARNPARATPDMWIDRIVAARTAPWTKDGRIFGVPHDVHPVVLAYRHDLFTEAGVDLPAATTWPAFHDACLRFQQYWAAKGFPYRHAVELTEAKADQLLILLNQQNINPVDDRGQIHLTDPKVARTIAFYAQMVKGHRQVAGESPGGAANFVQDLVNGNVCAFLMADWRLNDLKKHGGPGMAGKMRVMPLPVFDPATDAPTATWGGTMMGILKSCPDPQRAWSLLEHLYFSPAALEARLAETDILPPVRDVWGAPHYHRPDPFFGGQRVYELLIDLADRIPVRYVSPATALANQYLTIVVTRAVRYCEQRGSADGLEPLVQLWLADAAVDLERRIEHTRIE